MQARDRFRWSVAPTRATSNGRRSRSLIGDRLLGSAVPWIPELRLARIVAASGRLHPSASPGDPPCFQNNALMMLQQIAVLLGSLGGEDHR